ncbi:MAG: hypothetical protein ACKOC5_08095 [Chloroflexota bacterium]
MTDKKWIYEVLVRPYGPEPFTGLAALDPQARVALQYSSVEYACYQIETGTVIDMLLNNEEPVIVYNCQEIEPAEQ